MGTDTETFCVPTPRPDRSLGVNAVRGHRAATWAMSAADPNASPPRTQSGRRLRPRHVLTNEPFDLISNQLGLTEQEMAATLSLE